jgi:hypothetical protein
VRWRLTVVVAATAAAVAPVPSAWVERFYSAGMYLACQPRITASSNAASATLFDLALALVAGVWLTQLVRDAAGAWRGRWGLVVTRCAVRTGVLAAVIYLTFLAVWGLNYRRVPLAEKLAFDAGAPTLDGARALARVAVAQLNARSAEARAESPLAAVEEIPQPLAAAFVRVQRELGATRVALPARPKHSVLNLYFERAAVDGMTDPFFLETLVQSALLPVERPMVVAHEWSHLAGYADEGEASFVGWLTCLRGTLADQYSGWLFLYSELTSGMPAPDRADLGATLAPGPRADLLAIAARIERQVSPRLSRAGWLMYDRYLKANRVQGGTASYADVVRLALGVKFMPDWIPVRKGS